jgi:hypothetical protein
MRCFRYAPLECCQFVVNAKVEISGLDGIDSPLCTRRAAPLMASDAVEGGAGVVEDRIAVHAP